ncbi:hypothetical protein ACTXGO_02310 [Psychrobacter sp. T6-1]|uniref:hypothetical protein n=1 Tax=Psychrobacter sp. T6-1 TaxID=3457447 RepID=UPI003FD5B3FF
MQRKHLIAFTLATVFMLLGFNMINNYFNQKNRAALMDADVAVVKNKDEANDSISGQSLGEQPKAIIDNVTADIEQAQNLEQQRLEQMQESAE